METAVRQGVPGIIGECGGSLSCATCHVYVAADDLDAVNALYPMSEMEDEMLYSTAAERTETSRLSCQLKLIPDSEFQVTTPPTQV